MDLTIRALDDRDKGLKGLAKLDERLPKPSFCCLVQGGVKNGKTTLALNLIRFYGGFFKTVIWVSPTAMHDEKVMKVGEALMKLDRVFPIVSKINKDTMASIKA